MRNKSNRLRKPKADPTVKVALSIGIPLSQVANDRFVQCDVVNHTEADHRAMVRALGTNMINQDARRTLRRKPKIDQLRDRGIISDREAKACEWYQITYESEYETKVRIADWEAAGHCSDRAYGHWPVSMDLGPHISMFEYAREAIPPLVRPLFDRVVLHGRPLGKLALTFRMAAKRLLERIEDRVEL